MGTKSFLALMAFLSGLLILMFYGFSAADEQALENILKWGSAAGVFLGIAGAAFIGYLAGQSYDSYPGWERYTHGAGMFFNRKPFRRDEPTYRAEGETSRVDWLENIQGRAEMTISLMLPPDGSKPKWGLHLGIDAMPEPLKSYFQNYPEKYEGMLKNMGLVMQQIANWEKFSTRYAIADAWSAAMGSIFAGPMGIPITEQYPAEPKGPPEEWDYRGIRLKKPLPFKSPEHASQLIKKITHTFGATLVGITRLNPDWCYQGFLRGVGPGDYDVPDHWKYAVVFATPHEWDAMYANPTYGTSFDAYSRERIIGGRLESFIHELGYPARAHVPPASYDMMMPPVAIDAGLGEQSRNGILITPELGSNARLACVTTDIPMETDRPVDIGVGEFCRKCKICAEHCPTGAISHKDKPDVEFGYRRWRTKDDLCFNTWAQVAQSHPRGCRICLAVCPYTRKNNWIHAASRYIDPRDVTGTVSSLLLRMQKAFFQYPKAKDFLPPPQGKNATYHAPPDWLQTEKWFDVEKNW